MANTIISNVLIPIISMTLVVGFLTGVGWLVYRGLNKLIPNLNLWIKYNLFKRKMSEDSIEWCYNLLSVGGTEIDARMMLLKKGFEPEKVEEMLYIFNQVKKEVKEENE